MTKRYGEHWARHWQDVARYSDKKGYVSAREERFWVHARTYRDWVVRALNNDMPYDRIDVVTRGTMGLTVGWAGASGAACSRAAGRSRQSSAVANKSAPVDVEECRDSLLAASGNLDLGQSGRPPSLFERRHPTRHTLYGLVDRQFLPSTLRVFDFADRLTPWEQLAHVLFCNNDFLFVD